MPPKPTSHGLTPLGKRFVAEYLLDLNATRAYMRAHPHCTNENTAAVNGWKLLRNAKVKALIATGTAKQLAEQGLSAARVLEELRRLAFSDLRPLFDRHGCLKPIGTLTDAQAAAVAGMEVIIKNAQAGDGHTDTIHKIKLWDKTRALEMLAKHFKLLTEVIQVETSEAQLARLDQGRLRNAHRAKG